MPSRPIRDRRTVAGLAMAVLVAAAGCAGAAPTSAPTEAPVSARPTPAAVASTGPVGVSTPPPASPASAAPAPVLTGDAATNEACKLASVAEIVAEVEAGVREIKGLTSPGAFAPNSLSCAWYLDSKEIGIPSVLVQWEFPVEAHHDAVVGLYRSVVEQGLATPIDGLGDMAMLQGPTAEVIAGNDILRVSVLQHLEPTEADKEDVVALLRLMLERTDTE